MVEIIISKYAGFCSGVKRCIDIAEEEIRKNKKVFALGDLLHNEEEIKRLNSLGLITISSIEEINEKNNSNSTLIIRTHGIEKNILEILNKKIKNYIDGTCPIVKRNQKIVSQWSNKGYNVVIYGNIQHPEIKALISYINPKVKYFIINSAKEVENLNFSSEDKILLIAQTTKETNEYNKIIEKFKKFKNLKISYSICKETILREEDTKILSQKVDCIIIIGGKNSANTKKLVNIAKIYNQNVFLVNSDYELKIEELKKYKKIGITSGASTPKWLVEKIVNKIKFLS